MLHKMSWRQLIVRTYKIILTECISINFTKASASAINFITTLKLPAILTLFADIHQHGQVDRYNKSFQAKYSLQKYAYPIESKAGI
jgi:hypothetical protein